MLRARHRIGADRAVDRVKDRFTLLHPGQSQIARAENIRFVESPHSWNAPVVVSKAIENPELIGYRVHTRPIRIHRNALRVCRTAGGASALDRANGPSIQRLK